MIPIRVRSRLMKVIAKAISSGRIGAITLRYLYLLKSSWPRVFEMSYWPSVQVLMWGFITQFFSTHIRTCSPRTIWAKWNGFAITC